MGRRVGPIGRWARSIRPPGRLRVIVAAAGVVLLSGVATLVTSAVAEPADIVALDGTRLSSLTAAAGSCPALTPARLAGQVMATTGFEGTPGGIAGLTAAEWEIWKPWDDARPDDEKANLLALAHFTCDLIGNLRTSGFTGDLWPLALAAFASSLQDVRAAAGVPEAVAAFVGRAQEYAAAYERSLGVRPGATTTGPTRPTGGQPDAGTPTLTVSPDPGASADPGAVRDPGASPAPTAASPTTGSLRDEWGPGVQVPALHLSYPDFSQVSGLRLRGSAKTAGGRLVLAEDWEQAGSVWATQRVDARRSFSSSFSAVVHGPADGLAFVIQADGEDALGGIGAGLGYGGQPDGDPERTIRPSVAVEIDTWHNGHGYDPDWVNQHIAVTTNGDVIRHHAWADPGFDLQNNEPFYIWVSYSALSRTLTVYASRTSDKPAAPLLTYSVDLRAHLGADTAWIGLTGGTGLLVPAEGRDEVLSWTVIQS